MLDKTDDKLAQILEALQKTGVGKYGEFIGTKAAATLELDKWMAIGSLPLIILFGVLAVISNFDDGTRLFMGILSVMSLVVFLCAVTSLPADMAAVAHPEGAVAQQILDALKAK